MNDCRNAKDRHEGISGRGGRCVWVELNPRIRAIGAIMKNDIHPDVLVRKKKRSMNAYFSKDDAAIFILKPS
jgi:hypothetical protein